MRIVRKSRPGASGTVRAGGQRVLAAGFAAGLLMPLLALVSSSAATTVCTLTPVLRDVTVNQGVGSSALAAANYSPLARGKETEVRLYLSKPSCAGRGSGIGLTSATLTMTVPGATKTYTPVSPLSSTTATPLVDYTAAPAPDSTGDPKFVIPGPDLISSTPTSRFTATFTAAIQCTTCNGATLRLSTLGGQSISALVEQKTKALRILVVPMGSALSSTDSSTFQAGMNSLARVLPVPKAGGQLTGPLTATSSAGGIRYAVNSGVASVPLTNGKYCGNLNNFDAIKAQLAQYRNDWNAANSANTTNPDLNPTADVVLGVISAAGSSGGDAGCAEGMASTRSPEAWVRLIPAGTTPSNAGALMAMEIAHTFGAEGAWSDPFNLTHSAHTEADAATNRAYNITTRSFLAADRSAMKSGGTDWNQDTTVYEKQDFNFLMCRLGGQPNTDCLTTGTVGTVNGVANGPTFVMSGKTNNTAAGTEVVEAFSTANVAFTERPASSLYTLRFLNGTTVAAQVPVAVRFETSVHVGGAGSDQQAPTGLFTVAVPFPLNATSQQLIYTPAGGSEVVLFSSHSNGKPALRQFTVSGSGSGGFDNYTAAPSYDDYDPALSRDGKWLAWVADLDGPVLEVGSTSDSNRSNNGPFSGFGEGPTHPSWNADGTELAYAAAGSIYTIPVDTTADPSPTFGESTRIYDGTTNPAADDPSYSPDGTRVAFDSGGDIYTIPAAGGDASPVTHTGGSAVDPSWSLTPGDPRLAFTQYTGTYGIYTIDPSTTETPSLLAGTEGGSEPSWGTDGTLAFTVSTEGGSDLHAVSTSDGSNPPPSAIDGQSGSNPAYLRRGVSAFTRQFSIDPQGGAQDDIMLERPGLSVTATGGVNGGATDLASLQNLRLTVYYQCAGSPERSVLGLALKPTGFSGEGTADATASFAANFPETELCGGQGGGTATGILSDFFSTEPFPGQPGFDAVLQDAPVGSSPQPPVAAIVDPAEGATFFNWESIALQGEGSDRSLFQVADANLQWSVSGSSVARTGSTVDLAPLPKGDYRVTLTATDPDTQLTDTATRLIHVVQDTDRDGLSDDAENSQGCFPLGAATDGNSINLDSDSDGIPDGQDPAPCTANTPAYSPTVTFDPATLYVPANGNYVTVYVAQNHGTPSLASLQAGSVSIASITGIPVNGTSATTVNVTGQPFATNRSWTLTETAGKDQVGTAKFDRQQLGAFLAATFKMGQRLTIGITGYSSVPAWTFSGSGTTTVKKG